MSGQGSGAPAGDDPAVAAAGTDPGKEYRAETGIPVVPAMDGFRAVAIGGIALFHLIGIAGAFSSDAAQVAIWGTLPHLIDALFMISGFVLFLPTVASGGEFGSVRAFGIRRAARLLPAYWLAIGVLLLMIALWPSDSFAPSSPPAGDVLIHLLLLQMPAELVNSDFASGLGINGPLWTLSVETAFYLLLPLIAGAFYRRPLLGLAIAALIAIGWKEAILHLGGIAELLGFEPTGRTIVSLRVAADDQFPAWTYSFALGMTSAWLFVELRRRLSEAELRIRARHVQLISLVALGLFSYLLGRFFLDYSGGPELPNVVARRNPLITLGFSTALAAFMLATVLGSRRGQQPFVWGPMRALGDISYGVYMIHLPLLLFVLAASPALVDAVGAFWVLLLIGLPLSVLYGWLSARLVERPIRRWAHGRRLEIEGRLEDRR